MKQNKFKISKKVITKNTKPFLIAEVAQAHGGKLKEVFKLID